MRKLVSWGFSGGRCFLRVAGHVVAMEGDVCRDMKVIVDEGTNVVDAFFQRDLWTKERFEKVVQDATYKSRIKNFLK